MTVTGRPDWSPYFLDIARAVSARGDCIRARHGCVIVKDRRIVSTGYNGAPAGSPDSCLAGGCPRGRKTYSERPGNAEGNHDYSDCIALHAEQNAVAWADHSGTVGAVAYQTGAPCDMCRKLLRAAGISAVVYRDSRGLEVAESLSDGGQGAS